MSGSVVVPPSSVTMLSAAATPSADRADLLQDRGLGSMDRIFREYAGGQPAQEVGERRRGTARLEAELLDQPGGVDHPAVYEEVELIEAEVPGPDTAGEPGQRRHARFQHRYGDPPGTAYCLGQRDRAGAGDVERARVVFDDRPVQHLERVVDVHELQSRVAAEHGRQRGLGEVPGQGGVRVLPDERGEPQRRGRHVRPAAAESAQVALDVEDVPGETAARHLARFGRLGEDRRIAEDRAVGRRGRAHHDLLQPRHLLAGREQLHRADDVLLFHHRAAAGVLVRGRTPRPCARPLPGSR